jgi:hypothetical protein
MACETCEDSGIVTTEKGHEMYCPDCLRLTRSDIISKVPVKPKAKPVTRKSDAIDLREGEIYE